MFKSEQMKFEGGLKIKLCGCHKLICPLICILIVSCLILGLFFDFIF